MATSKCELKLHKKRSLVHDYFNRVGVDVSVCKLSKMELKMPAGNTTNLCIYLSCKNRETCDEMIGEELSNVSVTSQNKYNLARLKFNMCHINMVRVIRISRVS